MKMFRRVLLYSLAIIALMVAYYRFWFLRLPDRKVPHNEQVFVSPANGTVVSIHHWHHDELVVRKGDDGAIDVWTKDVDTAGTAISIQLNIFNAHYQRSPTGGKVLAETYTPGNFHNAISMSNKYGIRFENEHNEFLIQSVEGKKYKVIQIAGLVARRIVSYVKPGDEIKQGDLLGLIRLGSQVTLIFPHDVKVVSKVGDLVVDGETVIAMDK